MRNCGTPSSGRSEAGRRRSCAGLKAYAITGAGPEGDRRPSASLEPQPHAELRLARVTESIGDRAVEVEDQVGRRRTTDILRVGEIEHLEDRLDRQARRLERTAHPDVPR